MISILFVALKTNFMKFILNLTFILICSVSFSQSKKEQIEILNKRVDSLNEIVGSERKINLEKSNKISELTNTITILESSISSLTNNVSKLTSDLQTSKTETATKTQEISILQSQLKTKTDSLTLILNELKKLKPAPKIEVTNNAINQVTQSGSYKSVKIGTQTWMLENLNVSTFRNGDPIPEAKTDEEWEKAGKEGKPVWCYYDNDPKNGAKYGKLYNWYAVNDPRELAPIGWHVSTDVEWEILHDFLGGWEVAGKKMKSTSGWNNWQKDITCSNCENWNSEYRRKTACHVCKDTRVSGKKTYSGNGTNTSGFSGVPGGHRYESGRFYNIGENCYLGIKSENISEIIYNTQLIDDTEILFISSIGVNKGNGFSVRCIKD